MTAKNPGMAALYEQWKDCTQCGLHLKRRQVVFASGNGVDPKIFIIGEAPGPEEDKKGVPFYGTTGQLLRLNLRRAGIDPDKDCFITNAVMCFPTNDGKDFRGPLAPEILACRPRLDMQFRMVRPTVQAVVLLGKRAAATLLYGKLLKEPESKLNAEKGWSAIGMKNLLGWQDKLPAGFPKVYVTYHPSYISRIGANESNLEVSAWQEDLKAVADYALKGTFTDPRG